MIGIAKPPGGFEIHEPDTIKQLIDSQQARWPRLAAYWADIKSRLKQTGHREGIPRHQSNARLFIAEGDDASSLPTVKVAYEVLGDTLYIRAVWIGPAIT